MQRIDVSKASPAGFQAVLRLDQHVRASLGSRRYELIKLRASMVNGCAYCVDMHSRALLADGEDSRRLFGLAAWWEGPWYSGEERAVLALTDAITRLEGHGVPDEVWDAAAEHLDDQQLADVVLAIAAINVWNRIAIPTRLAPPVAAG